MTKHYICCYNENRELEHFEVPKSISVYIRQLECEIKYKRGGVQRLYPDRFGGNYNIEDWEKRPLDDGDFLFQNFGGNTPIVPDETMEELLKNGVKNEKL